MKTRLQSYASWLLALALLVLASTAGAKVTTTLLSQNFSSSTFPPTTNQVGNGSWTANMIWNGCTSYGCTTPGWAWNAGGATGANGSALAYTSTTYSQLCYGTSYGPITFSSPSISCNSADSQYVDFDLYFPQNYYFSTGSYPQMAVSIDIISGTSTVKTLNASTSSGSLGDNTFYDGMTPPGADPSAYGYYGSSYWRHYHLALPFGVSSTGVTFKVYQTYGSCYYTYWYDDYICFDNIVITDVAGDNLKILGPSPLAFANTPVGVQTPSLYVKLQNQSTGRAINISNIALAGLNPGDFVITRTISSIPIGGTDSIGIAYKPTVSGVRAATLTFKSDADNMASGSVPLSGFGVSPSIAIPQNLILFSRKYTRFRQTITQSFLVSSTGAVPLTMLPPPATYFQADNAGQYTIVRFPSAPIQPGAVDTVTVAFTPMFEGGQPATLYLASNAQQGTLAIPCRAAGVLARLQVNNITSPYNNNITVGFDSVNVGTQKCLPITLFNPGTDTLILTKNFLASKDYDFSYTPLSGADTAIAPGVTKTINACFTPLRSGFRTATVRLNTNIPLTFPVNPPTAPNTYGADTSAFTITLTGTGVPFGTIAVTGVDSVASPVATQACMNDTIWNTGSADISVTSVHISGADSAEFVANGLPALPFTVPAGAYKAFTICATPAALGARTALFTANGVTGVETAVTASLPLSAYGQSICDSVGTVKALPAVTCLCSNGDTAIYTVSNCGDVATAYTATITGAGAADYTILGAATSPIEAAHTGKATFTVRYMPSARGASAANLVITGGSAPATIALTGKGGAPVINGTAAAATTSVNKISPQFTITLTNSGECPWTPGAPMLPSGSPFQYVSGGTSPIAANGGTGTMTFTFAPTTVGMFTQDITFPAQSCAADASSKVTLTGSSVASGVAMKTADRGYSIEQNYPNPFASHSLVTITLPQQSAVRMTIVDQTGQVVRTVLDQHMSEGSYNVSIEAADLASGTYYIQMTANDVVLTRQMVIQK